MIAREYKDCLTNEQLLKRFKNQFELVRYAIEIATGEIRSGNDSFGPNHSDNVAYQALSDIAAGTEILREAVKIEPVVVAKKSEKEEKKEKKSKSKTLR
jgi:hypothetical protein